MCASNVPSPNFLDLMMVLQVWQVFQFCSLLILSHSVGSVSSSCPSSWFILHPPSCSRWGHSFHILFGPWIGRPYAFWNLGSPHLFSVGNGLLWLCEPSFNLWLMKCPQTSCVSATLCQLPWAECHSCFLLLFSLLLFFFSFWTHAPLKSSSPVKLFLSRQTILASRSSSYHFFLKN